MQDINVLKDPKIDTLIKDIYTMLEEGINTEQRDNWSLMCQFSDSIRDSVSQAIKEGQREKSQASLRMSQIGKKDRMLWYDIKSDIKPTDINGSTKIKFIYGHMLESLLMLLTQLAGHKITENQKEVTVEGVKGHKDCRIDGMLVDIKSASPYAFKKFKDNTLHNDDPFGYIDQISGYAEAGNDNKAAFLAIDKSSGELALTNVDSVHMINATDRIKHLKNVLSSDIKPERCYSDEPDGKSGNKKLAIGCVFCQYKKDCWSDANNGNGLRAFKYANGNRYLTQVHKIPDVEEIPYA
tara:strand:- start:992 stop:1879 length:888 start_codon:yes stop_codon:yes gene_type:complete